MCILNLLIHRAAPRSYIHMYCTYAVCTIRTYTCIFYFLFLCFLCFLFSLFSLFFFIFIFFSDSRLAVMQPGYAVCCSHWMPLRMFPVIAVEFWRWNPQQAFWCIFVFIVNGHFQPLLLLSLLLLSSSLSLSFFKSKVGTWLLREK